MNQLQRERREMGATIVAYYRETSADDDADRATAELVHRMPRLKAVVDKLKVGWATVEVRDVAGLTWAQVVLARPEHYEAILPIL